MLLAVVLLYVGAVLVVNGIWLVGQARAASYGGARPEPAEPGAAPGEDTVTGHPTFIENREIAVLNIFTGFIGVVAATTFAVQGTMDEDLASIRASGYILLFAFTYLWVAANQFLGARGHAFGWYCLFVSITAMTPGEYKLGGAGLRVRYGVHPSPFGDALVGVCDRGLCALSFLTLGKDAAVSDLRARWPGAEIDEAPSANTTGAQRGSAPCWRGSQPGSAGTLGERRSIRI